MEHILTQCREKNTQLIWHLAQNLWPPRSIPWPEVNFGTILGYGCITLQSNNMSIHDPQQQRRITHQGPTRLLQILLSESAYLIWVLGCERVIQGKSHFESEIKARWLRVINERLTNDKITAIRIKRNDGFTKLVVNTWEQALENVGGHPITWINRGEVLVGRTFEPHTTQPDLRVGSPVTYHLLLEIANYKVQTDNISKKKKKKSQMSQPKLGAGPQLYSFNLVRRSHRSASRVPQSHIPDDPTANTPWKTTRCCMALL